MVALTAVAITACTPAAKTETKLAAVGSSRQMPMSRPMNQSMPMGQMMGGCPLGLKTLPLTPSQKATFDSVRTENRAVMQRDTQAAFARARAVLTDAQRATFDSASATHMVRMATMMSSGGGAWTESEGHERRAAGFQRRRATGIQTATSPSPVAV